MKAFFDELKKDHKEVKDILEKMSSSSKTAEKSREKLFAQLKEELVPHMKAENVAFYSVLMDKKNARQNALEATEEHNLTEMVFRQLEETPAKDELWAVKVKVLKDLIEHHIEEEEQEIFEIAQEEIEKDDFKQIMQAFQQEKEKVKSSIS
ncbi:MAG: hypothetical protein VR65_12695 [Desulfobulbaceae bacterium BRH_c16a]|nr:MAG: hypothetical protein VR65_12695 [Desulfobulbaceae bacterium BRH_c16a]